MSADDDGRFSKSLNIHTNTNHITTVNNYYFHLINIEDQTDIIKLELNNGKKSINVSSFFNKRETEIINLISLSFKSSDIAEKLSISQHTVENHRKNVLKKSNSKSSSELIAKSINDGLM